MSVYPTGVKSQESSRRFLREQLILVLDYLDRADPPDAEFISRHVESIVLHAFNMVDVAIEEPQAA